MIIAPGLLGPVSDPPAIARLLPQMPALARLLGRADQAHGFASGGEAGACEAFGVSGPPWPFAAAARAGEDGADATTTGDRWWLRADPAYLRVDTGHARLFGAYAIGIGAAESRDLLATLNGHFAEDGICLAAPVPDRWYLALERPSDLATHPPAEVAGRNIDAFMPTGEDAAAWRRRLNEAQMLLHDHPVNIERERRSALPINSLWIWGGGWAPVVRDAPQRVWADDVLTRGLGRLGGSEPLALPATGAELEPVAGTAAVADFSARDPLVHGEFDAWMDALGTIESRWLSPLLERLQRGDFDELELRPADGRGFRLTRSRLKRFWRRTEPWSRWLEPGA